MNGADGSQATIDAGSPRSQIADVSAPVPHPTSSQLMEGLGASHSTNARASGRLQRPMYASYASPASHRSAPVSVTSIPCPPNVPNEVRQALPPDPGAATMRMQYRQQG